MFHGVGAEAENTGFHCVNLMYAHLAMDVSNVTVYPDSPCNNKRLRNAQDDEEERKHFRRIVSAFKYYRKHSLARVAKTEAYLSTLPEHHQEILSGYREHLAEVRRCIEKNDQIITNIITDVDGMFINVHPENPSSRSSNMHPLPIVSDLEKVQATLKQLVRDWSSEGARERLMCYQPIIDEVLKNFPPEECDPKDLKVLVPGAGLGRLAYEIARQGYQCQGNEFSLFMLFASNFVLNRQKQGSCHAVHSHRLYLNCPICVRHHKPFTDGPAFKVKYLVKAGRGYPVVCGKLKESWNEVAVAEVRGVNTYKVYPWVHQYVNNLKAKHQTRSVSFPDVNPSDLPPHSQFSMAVGDFLEVYTQEDEWDCVATCFFIDCANNVVAFIETIYKILKPGCVWINLGPLLYHFADILDEDSIEPSYEVVRHVAEKIGFIIEKEDTSVPTTYAQNPDSMLQYEYKSVFMVCRKPASSNGHLTPTNANVSPESHSPIHSPTYREQSGPSSPDNEQTLTQC